MSRLATHEGTAVPRNVWIAVAAVLLWALVPFGLAMSEVPDLIRGDINWRSLRFSNFVSPIPSLLIAAGSVAGAEAVRRRKRGGWRFMVALGAIVGIGGILITFLTSEFDVLFFLSLVVLPGVVLGAAFLPGVRQWCNE